jgi:predicted phage baseplate assembly protein
MPIIAPSLDDRRFDDLVEELLARIPAHTPEWTHPRQGDPGRTLIELVAWLTDTLLYRANLIPERQRLVFLKLLGQQLRPARPARTVVSLRYAQDSVLGASTLLPGAAVKGGPLPFETLRETTVLPVTALAFHKRPLAPAEASRMAGVLQGLATLHRLDGAARGYATTPLFDDGRAVPDGIDVFAASTDRALWLALLAPAASDAAAQIIVNDAARKALGGGDSGAPALLTIGLVPALRLPSPFDDIGPRAEVPVLWEITTQGRGRHGVDYLSLTPRPSTDTTAGLTRPGTVQLSLPDESLIRAPSNDVGENPAAGVGDTPPRLDDVEQAARLLAWLRLRPVPARDGRPPAASLRLAWLGINAVEVDQCQTLGGRVLGTATGAPDLSLSLPQGNVDAATLDVQVEEPERGYQRWTRVDDLGALGADPTAAREARVYELDAEAGTLRFGDGVRGRLPETRMRIRLASGRFGGGRAGNLPAGTLTELSGQRVGGGSLPPIRVHQPLAATGGDDAETLAVAERRIPAVLRHRDRAVTAEDYRRLALDTPGLEVGRVAVLPRFKPRDRRFDVPGVVTVMALPARAIADAPNPRPDRPFLETLHAHLAARVPLSTELYVIGCEYVALGLSVGVTVRDGAARDQVLFEVRDALRRLLWPLPPGGVDGDGWTLGRSVRERELEVQVSRVPGVREVSGLRLFERSLSLHGPDWRALPRDPRDGSQTLALSPWQLPELLSVIVADGEAPDSLKALANPFADDRAVAVPLVPSVC